MTRTSARGTWRALLGLVLLLACTCTPKPSKPGASKPGASPPTFATPPPSGPAITPASPGASSSVLPLHLEKPVWLIAASALSSLVRLDSDGTVTRRWFADNRTLVIAGPGAAMPAGWTNRVLSLTSLDAIRLALAQGVPPDVRAILYDVEAWSLTPIAEQANPVGSIATAARLVHGAGLQFIAAPGVDLMGRLHPGQGPYYRSYVATRFAGAASDSADIFVVQAQTYQNDPATYGTFVRQVAAQARAAHPGVLVLAGLSTGPHGEPTTADAMLAAVAATGGTVDGYWLNIPGPGPQCPACGPPNPGIALEFLRKLGA
ncbi:MAG TPA: hypothetical protein VGK51_01605 [Actinomycetota bacterium]